MMSRVFLLHTRLYLTSQTENLKRVINRASYGREGRHGINDRRVMRPSDDGPSESQVLFIHGTHESDEKEGEEGKGPQFLITSDSACRTYSSVWARGKFPQ